MDAAYDRMARSSGYFSWMLYPRVEWYAHAYTEDTFTLIYLPFGLDALGEHDPRSAATLMRYAVREFAWEHLAAGQLGSGRVQFTGRARVGVPERVFTSWGKT